MDVLVKMSVSGAVLIAVIVIVRALAVNRLPKKAFLWLWAAAFFCLMIPVRLPSPISVYRPSGQLERLAVRPGLLLSEAAGQAASEASGAAAVMASHLSVWHGIWIAGAVLLAAFFLVGHLRGRRVYSASLPVEQPFAKAWLEENRIRRPVQIRYSDRIESPLTYGFLWPVLLVPADMDWRMRKRRLLFCLMKCPISEDLMRLPNGFWRRRCVYTGLTRSYGPCIFLPTGIWSWPVTRR